MFTSLTEKLYNFVAGIPFDALVWTVWGSYLAIFVFCAISCALSVKVRRASKKPFMSLTNAYAALTLALFLMQCELAQSVLVAALFWVVGYFLYGLLCAVTPKGEIVPQQPKQVVLSAMPQTPPKSVRAEVPAAKNTVRLEHAVSVTDKLLGKNLGKTDRQELEKLKNTLAVLQLKGSLSPAEADILNENFNMLLKLMAKYNI